MKKSFKILYITVIILIMLSTLIFSPVKLTKAQQTSGVVTIAFDDGNQDQFDNAYPLLQQYGMNGTFYVITGFLGTSGYMTVPELQTLQASGNEIGSHSVDHPDFLDLTAAQTNAECSESQQFLQSNGLSGKNFAYPYGDANSTTDSIVLQYYRSARYSYQSNWLNPISPSTDIPMGFAGEAASVTTALSQDEAAVDQAIATNSWVIIFFHHVVPAANVASYLPYGIDTTDFSTLLSYIANSGVRVLTTNQALNLGSTYPPTPSPTSATFGNTAVGSETNYFGTDKDASRFQLTQNGQLQNITTYFTSTGFSAKAAIYTDNNGAPSTLVAQSGSQSVSSTGWNTFALPQTALTAGYYWLCAVSSASSTGTMTPTSSNTHAWETTTYANEYTSTFGTPAGYEETATSIYATYTPTAIPTPSPTPTPTPVPTSTPTSKPTSTPTPTSSTFGDTAVGSLTNYFGTDKDASRFQLTQSGQVQSISTYFTTTGFSAKAAIYTDNNGAPNTLIAQSSSQTVTTTGWNTFTLPQSTLTTGYYWLCIISSSSSATGTMSSTTANTHAWKTTTYSNEYTSTFGNPTGYEQTTTSIYATYTPTPIPTPTITPTPTPSSSPTPSPSPTLTPTPTPTTKPTPTPTTKPTPTPTTKPTPTPTPKPTPTPTRHPR